MKKFIGTLLIITALEILITFGSLLINDPFIITFVALNLTLLLITLSIFILICAVSLIMDDEWPWE